MYQRYYSWFLLAILFLMQMLAIGSTSYAFGLFVKPIGDELALSRASMNQGFILLTLGAGCAAPLIGRLFDRYPARPILLAGGASLGTGLLLLSLSNSPWIMGLCVLVPIAAGTIALGPLAASTLIAQWFTENRGRALGISAVATSVGGALLVPLLAHGLDHLHWRTLLRIEGAVIGTLTIGLALLVRNPPQWRGGTRRNAGDQGAAPTQLSFSQLVWNRKFWCIVLALGLLFAISKALMVSIVPFATDIGLSLTQATLLVSCISIASIFGKLAVGYISDYWDQRWLMVIVVSATITELTFFIIKPSFPVLAAVCCLAGFAMGGKLPIWGNMVANTFGAHSYGAVMGAMSPIITALGMLTVYFVGAAYDRAGSYDLAFLVFIGIAVIAASFALLIRPRMAMDQTVQSS